MSKDTCIKANTYCPVHKGIVGADCWHDSKDFSVPRTDWKQVDEINTLREQVKKLENRLNKDSQEFTILCAKETEKVLREQLAALAEQNEKQRETHLYLAEQNKQLKAELKSIDGALNDPRANLTLTTSEIIWELKEQVEKLTKEGIEYREKWLSEQSRNLSEEAEFEILSQQVVALEYLSVVDTAAIENLHEQLAALAEQNAKLREVLVDCEQALDECRDYPITYDSVIEALSLPNLATPVLNSIPKEPTPPVFDADSPRFRQVFDETVQAHNLPSTRKGDGYRSPITQWCFELAYSVVNRLRLYEK